MRDLSELRRDYKQGGLRRKDLPQSPWKLFELWMDQARQAEICDPTAMVLATVDANGQPFQRVVLLKKFDENGLVFFTNTGSRKSQHIKDNAKVNVIFPWNDLERQIAITGEAEALPTSEVVSYFATRPKDSQIGAWVSQQSSKISARGVLEGKFLELKQKFAKGEVPLPSFWGGYRIKPDSFEFWQGGDRRLHDRFLYSLQDNDWSAERLAP
ncbi:pyridoxamine 5'-phosphate oxidase [Paraferrimonas sedimenticola]|uniref:Pyridoxine/pyridoxamine 5'-phosphate oxidase n=1 Tax=Paraferrimonas sedimenticola TaxID=375674 RepID=A0AA37RWK2_9GAMM|nr:pyridoxamine 5'-phosphate oxidase [Paraferrimonas sedimenticola]GLP96453.1 pyridoxine/pyridoxamine 5'-phosphate oxidase [Paraferrimonas sedimenticola]